MFCWPVGRMCRTLLARQDVRNCAWVGCFRSHFGSTKTRILPPLFVFGLDMSSPVCEVASPLSGDISHESVILEAESFFEAFSDAEEILDSMIEDGPPEKRRRLVQKQLVDLPPDIKPSKTTLRARFAGLTIGEYTALRKMGVPIVMFNLLALIIKPFMNLVGPTRRITRALDCVEFYAGVGNVARAFKNAGLESRTYDIVENAEDMNMSSAYGFFTAVFLCMKLKAFGLSHWASVCSTWVFMSQGSTKRYMNIWGTPESCSGVVTANEQVVRMTMLFMLCNVRQVYWLLEQPMTSVLDQIPVLVEDVIGWSVRVNTCMGAYWAKSKKPTWLKSNGRWSTALRRSSSGCSFDANDNVVQLEPGLDGKKRVSGGPGLKATQVYPEGYGTAVLDAWMDRETHSSTCAFEECDDSDASDEELEEMPEAWRANLQDVAEALNVSMDKFDTDR